MLIMTKSVTDLANNKWNDQQFGYIQARQEAYGSIGDQLDTQYKDAVNGTTTLERPWLQLNQTIQNLIKF